MTSAASSSPSSSPSATQKKYDVYISFRSQDTRTTFPGHLHHALNRNGISTYIADEILEKGDTISPALLKPIEESRISVIILSENYASSSWCLEELNHILRCKETNNQIIIPVFYNVDPSDVRKQKGRYASAFAAHEVRFKDRMEKVQEWRYSLSRVSDLSGFCSSNYGSDHKLVEAILQDIREKLDHMLPCHDYSKDLVGIEKRIEQVESMLNISSSEVRIVGIWGRGGIGKTTLASSIFYRFAATDQFEGCCFLENVKETKPHDLIELQWTLFSELLKEKNLNLADVIVRFRLRGRKVLVVLDDVDDTDQFKYLAGDRDWFGSGSRIIITTRNREILTSIPADAIYEVEKLDSCESLELFCSKAFRRSSPTTDYAHLSHQMVSYAGGNPLALKVLGSHLYSKSINEWKSTLDKLNMNPVRTIYEVLKISYDGLDEVEQKIFLVIACFLKDKDEVFIKRELQSFGHHLDTGLKTLVDRSLITRTNNSIQVHDLLQEMGRQIFHEEAKKLGWLNDDVCRVLKLNTQVANLKEMELSNLYLHYDHYLWARGSSWEIKVLEGLVASRTSIRKVPSAIDRLVHLNYFDLKNCKRLETLPMNIHKLISLQYINLFGCSKLNKFPVILGPLERLTYLNLGGTAIRELDSSIAKLIHLKNLSLKMCKNLKLLPSSLYYLHCLEKLDICCCQKLKSLPKLPLSLVNLNAKGCTSLKIMSRSRFEFSIAFHKFFQCYSIRFDFLNCVELDQKTRKNVMAETQLRIFRMAYLAGNYPGVRKGIFEFWCPGNEIPTWFSHQSAKSSIKIKLDTNWCINKFVGFALCAVVGFEDCYIDDKFKFYFQFDLNLLHPRRSRERISKFTWRYDPDGGDRIVSSDHVFLFYYYDKNSFSTAAYSHVNEALLNFHSNNSDCKVKMCGIHLLYAEDVVSMSIAIARDVGEPSDGRENEDVFKTSNVVTKDVDVSSSSSEDDIDDDDDDDDEVGIPDLEEGTSNNEHEESDGGESAEKTEEEEDDDDDDEVGIPDLEEGTTNNEHEESDGGESAKKTEEEEDDDDDEVGIPDLEEGTSNNEHEESDGGESAKITEEEENDEDVGISGFEEGNRNVSESNTLFGRQSGSDKGPQEQLQETPEQVVNSIIMEIQQRTKQTSEYLQTVMATSSSSSLSSRVVSSLSILQHDQSPEKVIQSLCSKIIEELQDQNNEISQNLETIMATTPTGFLNLFPKPSASTSGASQNLFQQLVDVPEQVIESLQSQMVELRDRNEHILQLLHMHQQQQNRKVEALVQMMVRQEKNKSLIPVDKLSDIKVCMAYLEWYKKCSEDMEIGYYDSYKKKLYKPDKNVDELCAKLANFWMDMVVETEKKPQNEGASFRNRYIIGGTKYRRLVEPLYIAKYYKEKDGRDYENQGRDKHFILLEQWLLEWQQNETRSPPNDWKRKYITHNLTEDSCFWAKVEEAILSCKLLKNTESSDEEKESSKEKLKNFEDYVLRLLKNYSVSPEIFLKGSSFMQWWEDYKEAMGRSYTSPLTDIMENRKYEEYSSGELYL